MRHCWEKWAMGPGYLHVHIGHAKDPRPDCSLPRPFFRVVFAASDLKRWNHLSPWQKASLTSSEVLSPQTSVILLWHSSLPKQASVCPSQALSETPMGLGSMGSQHKWNTEPWLQLLPRGIKCFATNPGVSCLLRASVKFLRGSLSACSGCKIPALYSAWQAFGCWL